jgi:hypothetical protein
MIKNQTRTPHRPIILVVPLIAAAIGMTRVSVDAELNALAPSLQLGTTGGQNCVTHDAGGARLDNGSFVMLGQPLAGVAQHSDTSVTLGGIACLQAAQSEFCTSQEGDFNGDDEVNLADFGVFQVCFGGAPVGQCLCTDLNNDLAIDLSDFSLWLLSLP